MAKKQVEKENEDTEQSGGALTKEKYLKLKKNYSSLKQKVSDASNPIWDFMKKLEDEGGAKNAFKLSERFLSMEPIKAISEWRELVQYLEWGGFFDQDDIVDQAEGVNLKPGFKKAA